YSLLITDPEWTLVSLSGLFAGILGIFAILGIYHLNYEQGGVTLLIGTILFVLGLTFETVSLSWDIFIWPVICADNTLISFVSSGVFTNTFQFMSFFISLMVLLLSGTILTALGLLKTKKYGKLVPVLLIIGIIFYLAGSFLSFYAGILGLSIFSLAFILIARRLFILVKV
ncbi:MAG: hypothetical protein JXA06_02090, partial [Bacteroidetes bacterium]|nr:hypothetical protein [Bacteroidota bacterium]